jgi:hypothetical protein
MRLVCHTAAVLFPWETNYLVPNAGFIVEFLLFVAAVALLIVWPLVETIVRRQWGWTLGVVLLGPIGGLLWLVVGRREVCRVLASN